MAEQKQVDVQQQMQRLEKARDKADELSKEKSRMTGELGALQTQIKELEAKSKADFDCTIAELPSFVDKLKTEAETALMNAEIILGLREGSVTVQKPQVAAPATTPAPDRLKTAPKMATAVRSVRPVVDSGHDEDSLP